MATKTFTRKEVAEHKTNRDAWFIIHNEVYDVTNFLNEHPGGEEVLLEEAGKEATEAFEDVGHSTDARDMMKKFKIGEIVESEKIKTQTKAQPDWSSSDKKDDNSMKNWIVPILLGILATVFYHYYFKN